VHAALINDYESAPALVERDEPTPGPGQALLELRAAGLNPVDVTIGAGDFPHGSPSLPYVPGIEAVGAVVSSERHAPGTRVWVSGRGLGVAYDGGFAERFAAPDDLLVPVPDDADDVLAAAIGCVGIAGWMPLAWLAPVKPGESVLVLGATGAVGSIAVQAAKLLGAGRVVGAGRNPEKLERLRALGADEVVDLRGDRLEERLAAAFGDAPPTLVLDLLWGAPLEAAMAVVDAGARVVQAGESAGPTATLHSGHILGRVQILGFSNFMIPYEELAEGYATVLGHVRAGRIRLDVEAVPLARVADAWAQQADGADGKLVLVP
jgi:NADPH2:quinone reductase